jgi:hypothetical protein
VVGFVILFSCLRTVREAEHVVEDSEAEEELERGDALALVATYLLATAEGAVRTTTTTTGTAAATEAAAAAAEHGTSLVPHRDAEER